MLVFFLDFLADCSNSAFLAQPSLFFIPKPISDPLSKFINNLLDSDWVLLRKLGLKWLFAWCFFLPMRP